MSAVLDFNDKFGLVYHEPMEVYQAAPGISAGRLSELRKSALHYRHRIATTRSETAPMRLGTAAHCATLEPERFAEQFVAWDRRTEGGASAPRRGQFWDKFQADNMGKCVITYDELNQARDIAAAIRGNERAMRYLCEGDAEVSMYGRMDTVSPFGEQVTLQARARPDWIHIADPAEHYLVGVKTARDVRGFAFGNAAYRMGYHISWSFYADLYQSLTGVMPIMREIVVESAAPHDVVVYRITEDVLAQGRDDYRELLRTLVDCEQRREWLGIAKGEEQDLMLPTYAYEQAGDDLSDIGLEISNG